MKNGFVLNIYFLLAEKKNDLLPHGAYEVSSDNHRLAYKRGHWP